MQHVAQARLTHASGVVVWTTAEILLSEHGPLTPIWLQGIAQPAIPFRRCLFDVIPGKKRT
jgi:hypothetical protein